MLSNRALNMRWTRHNVNASIFIWHRLVADPITHSRIFLSLFLGFIVTRAANFWTAPGNPTGIPTQPHWYSWFYWFAKLTSIYELYLSIGSKSYSMQSSYSIEDKHHSLIFVSKRYVTSLPLYWLGVSIDNGYEWII